jgi:hypothetical protein
MTRKHFFLKCTVHSGRCERTKQNTAVRQWVKVGIQPGVTVKFTDCVRNTKTDTADGVVTCSAVDSHERTMAARDVTRK